MWTPYCILTDLAGSGCNVFEAVILKWHLPCQLLQIEITLCPHQEPRSCQVWAAAQIHASLNKFACFKTDFGIYLEHILTYDVFGFFYYRERDNGGRWNDAFISIASIQSCEKSWYFRRLCNKGFISLNKTSHWHKEVFFLFVCFIKIFTFTRLE